MQTELHSYSSPIAKVMVNVAPFRHLTSGRILALSGPSGAGKTSLAQALDGYGGYSAVSKLTTRPPRKLRGPDAYATLEAIETMRTTGDYLYTMEFSGEQYLLPATPVLQRLADGLTVLIDSPSLVALGLKRLLPDRVTSVFVDVLEPETTLLTRMRQRGDATAGLSQRLRHDLDFVYPLRPQFDVVYLNEDVPGDNVLEALRARDVAFKSHQTSRSR